MGAAGVEGIAEKQTAEETVMLILDGRRGEDF